MQISSNYSMNGVPYENRCRQKDIPQFSTERAKQENKSIKPYMEDTDFNEETFDMIGPNAPQEVKDAWIEAAKEEGDVDNIDILGNTTESAIQATKQALYNLDHPLEYVPKSIEVQRACMKEREFYVAFLERLEKL